MKKLLITGGSGFLGSRICHYYRNKYEILAPSHQELDICSLEAVEAYLDKYKPELIVHTAAVSDTGYTEAHPDESYEINVNGTEHLAKASGIRGIRLIFMSSDQVYNGQTISGETYDMGCDANVEDRDENPVNEYGRQKLEAERAAAQWNPNTVSLRLTWMYDIAREGMKTNWNLFTNLQAAVQNGEALSFAVHEYRGITNVWEVVKKLEAVFRIPAGVYNYGSSNSLPTFRLAELAADKLNSEHFVQLAGEADTTRDSTNAAAAGTPTTKDSTNAAAAGTTFIIRQDLERFAARPRNLTISTAKAEAAGIVFPTSAQGITEAETGQFSGTGDF